MKNICAIKNQRKPDEEFADKLGKAMFGYIGLLSILMAERFPAYIERVRQHVKREKISTMIRQYREAELFLKRENQGTNRKRKS